jgi:hypothetical protein
MRFDRQFCCNEAPMNLMSSSDNVADLREQFNSYHLGHPSIHIVAGKLSESVQSLMDPSFEQANHGGVNQ